MKTNKVIGIITVVCAYLVLAMPLALAQAINVNFYTPDGATKLPITASLPTPQDLVTKTVSFLPDPTGTLQNVLVKYDIKQSTHAINRGFVWLCKDLEPSECLTQKKEPISIQEFLNKERVWSDVGQITGTYPQKGNVLVLLNLDVVNQAGSSQSVWVGVWDEITTLGANPYQFSVKTNRIGPDSINVILEKEQFANLTADFINNLYMIPRSWVKEVQIPKVEGFTVNTISGTQLDNLDTPQQFGDPHKRQATDKVQTKPLKKQFSVEFPIAVLPDRNVVGVPITFYNNPAAICGEDTDKDGNACDRNLGEDEDSCPRDCGCASKGANFTASFSQVSSKDPGVCVNVNDIKLVISDIDTNLVSCETSHQLDFNARITNPPADLNIEEWWYNIDNKTKRTITCNKRIGQEYGCQLTVEPLDLCTDGIHTLKNNKLFANVRYSQGSVAKELSADIPDIVLNQRAISQDQIREFIQQEFRKINDDLRDGVDQAKKLMKTCVKYLEYSLKVGLVAAGITALAAIYEGGKAVGLWDWLGTTGIGAVIGGGAGFAVAGPAGAGFGAFVGGGIGKIFSGGGPVAPTFSVGQTLNTNQLRGLGVRSGQTSFSHNGYNYGLNAGGKITSVSNPVPAPQMGGKITPQLANLGFPDTGSVTWRDGSGALKTYTSTNGMITGIGPAPKPGVGSVPAGLAPATPVAPQAVVTKGGSYTASGPTLSFAEYLSFVDATQIAPLIVNTGAQGVQNLALQFSQSFTGTSSALSSASLNICQAASQIMEVYSRMANAQSFFVKFQLCMHNFDNLMGNGACDGGKSPGAALSAANSCMNLLQGCMTDLKQMTNEIKDFSSSLAAQQEQAVNRIPSSKSIDFGMWEEFRGKRVTDTCGDRAVKFDYKASALCTSPKITKTLEAHSQKVDTAKRESGNIVARADTILRYTADYTSTQPGASDIARNRTIDVAKQIDTSAKIIKSSSQDQSIQNLADSISTTASQIISTGTAAMDEFTVKQQALDIRGLAVDIEGLIPDLVKQADVTGQILNTWSFSKGVTADTVFSEGSGRYIFEFSCGDKTNAARWIVTYESNCARFTPVTSPAVSVTAVPSPALTPVLASPTSTTSPTSTPPVTSPTSTTSPSPSPSPTTAAWSTINTTLYNVSKNAAGDRTFEWDPMTGADNYTLEGWDPSGGATALLTQVITSPATSGSRLTYTLLNSTLTSVQQQPLFFFIYGIKAGAKSNVSNVVGPF